MPDIHYVSVVGSLQSSIIHYIQLISCQRMTYWYLQNGLNKTTSSYDGITASFRSVVHITYAS
jgi:hypothetical protein